MSRRGGGRKVDRNGHTQVKTRVWESIEHSAYICSSVWCGAVPSWSRTRALLVYLNLSFKIRRGGFSKSSTFKSSEWMRREGSFFYRPNAELFGQQRHQAWGQRGDTEGWGKINKIALTSFPPYKCPAIYDELGGGHSRDNSTHKHTQTHTLGVIFKLDLKFDTLLWLVFHSTSI